MRLCYIFNPNSGFNRRDPRLRAELRRRAGARHALRITEGPGHATLLAREAVEQGFGRVIAVGGDGTMNETAQALVGTGAVLGLVPCGSGNGLALHLGLPTRPAEALALADSALARSVMMDTGVADGHPFFNVMGLGLDAEISLRFNRLERRGLPAYVRTTLGAFAAHRSRRYRITDESGNTSELTAMLLAVCNSDQYGNQARIAPGASVSDGRLDLVALRPMNPFRLGVAALRLFNGSLRRSGGVTSLTGSSFLIERDAPGPLHTDGETHEAGPAVRVSVRPSSLAVLCPGPAADGDKTTRFP